MIFIGGNELEINASGKLTRLKDVELVKGRCRIDKGGWNGERCELRRTRRGGSWNSGRR